MNSIEAIKQTLFTQWNLMRVIRLVAGIFLAVQAMQMHDTIAGFISAILLFQAFTNTGCCGVSGCAVPASTKNSDESQEVDYVEIKEKKSLQ
jgi:Na+-translocating ferredoxin:NAD+ oxidoreductase RNF subunit RnfB